MTRRRFSGSFLPGTPRQSGWIALGIIATTSAVLGLAIVQPVQADTFPCTAGNVNCLITSINQANGNKQTNTIQLAGGTPYTLMMPIDGGPGLPEITSTLTILGENATTVIIERDATAPAFPIL